MASTAVIFLPEISENIKSLLLICGEVCASQLVPLRHKLREDDDDDFLLQLPLFFQVHDITYKGYISGHSKFFYLTRVIKFKSRDDACQGTINIYLVYYAAYLQRIPVQLL